MLHLKNMQAVLNGHLHSGLRFYVNMFCVPDFPLTQGHKLSFLCIYITSEHELPTTADCMNVPIQDSSGLCVCICMSVNIFTEIGRSIRC